MKIDGHSKHTHSLTHSFTYTDTDIHRHALARESESLQGKVYKEICPTAHSRK